MRQFDRQKTFKKQNDLRDPRVRNIDCIRRDVNPTNYLGRIVGTQVLNGHFGITITDLLKVTQVALRLNCSISTVYGLIESRRLGHYRCPGIRVSEEQLAEYVEGTRLSPRMNPTRNPNNQIRLRLNHLKF